MQAVGLEWSHFKVNKNLAALVNIMHFELLYMCKF